jgi:hypothetical protein
LLKATLRQILIVVCLSSIISNETPVPSPQELPHRNKDAGVGRIVSPPHPRATAALAASPAPWGGSSYSSPLRYSCRAEPWRSATWPMINTAGCRTKSSPSGDAVVPVWGCAHRRRLGPGVPLCGEVARGAAPGSIVGGGGGGGGGGAGFAARPPPPLCRADYASITTCRTLGVTDQDLCRSEAWLVNHCSCGRGGILLGHSVAPGGA